MKTAISIPDEVFEEAEAMAKELGVSRSELFTRAMRALLRQRADARVRSSYDEAYGDDPEAASDVARRRRANRKILEGTEW